MNVQTKPLDEVMRRGMELLSEGLGPDDAIRFIHTVVEHRGDYTAQRDALFGHLTLDQLLDEMQAEHPDLVDPD